MSVNRNPVTPDLEDVRDIWVDWSLNDTSRALGIELVPRYQAAFDAMIEAEIASRCAHCGERLNGTIHASGPQTALHRCAVDPYGYNGHPVGTPCIGTGCRGEVTKIYRDERSI